MSMYGIFVYTNPDGTTESSKVKQYQTYDEMVSDTHPGKYGIVLSSNTVYHRSNNEWIVGFPNVSKGDDYTAFEVYPNDTIIPVGESEILGGFVTEAIPVQMTHRMYIRSFHAPTEQDVVVDWGDGTTATLNQFILGENVSDSTGEYRYTLEHTYTESKKYIVKIYGRRYWAILPDKSNVATCGYNLMSRVFDTDLPIASHLYNLSSFCYGAIRLLNVDVLKGNFNSLNVQNMSYTFCQCRNMLSASGFYYNDNINAEGNVFENCWALQYTDYQLHSTGGKPLCFHRCKKLAVPIENLLPRSFNDKSVNMDRCFNECGFLTGTIPANKLWEDTDVVFTNTSQCFRKTPVDLKAQAPVSWGGTLTE